MLIVAVLLALASAVLLALGTHVQQRAVAETGTGSRLRLRAALATPRWWRGLVLMGLAIAANLWALGLAPVAIVQPLGALALVVAVLISVRVLRMPVSRGLILAIAATTLPILAFVGLCAGFARAPELSAERLHLLGLIAIIVAILAAAVAVSRAGHLVRVALAGAVFGSVATCAHVLVHAVLAWIQLGHPLPGGMVIVAVGLAAGTGVGGWLVQTAYADGPAETVLAGLTVIDPLVAVLLGAVVLGEYAGIDPVTGLWLILTGGLAVIGVWLISRWHPTVNEHRRASDELPTRPACEPSEATP